MLRRKARAGETFRIIVPGTSVMHVFVPGCLLEVVGYPILDAQATPYALVRVQSIPDAPAEYNVVVPKGSIVHVHEE